MEIYKDTRRGISSFPELELISTYNSGFESYIGMFLELELMNYELELELIISIFNFKCPSLGIYSCSFIEIKLLDFELELIIYLWNWNCTELEFDLSKWN